MSWVKVDDQLHANPKVLEVSLSARGLWITCLSWVGDKESDGVLPASIVRLHAGAMFDELSAELVAAGLWTRAANGKDFEYHDYLAYNKSHAQLEEERASGARRQQSFRDRRHDRRRDEKPSNAVTAPVSNTCSAPDPVPVPEYISTPQVPLSESRGGAGGRGKRANAAAARGSRLPDGFAPSDDDTAWAGREYPDVDTAAQTDAFCDYWRSKAGKDGVKLDWQATWRNWIRRAAEYSARRQAPTPSRASPLPPRETAFQAARRRNLEIIAEWGAEMDAAIDEQEQRLQEQMAAQSRQEQSNGHDEPTDATPFAARSDGYGIVLSPVAAAPARAGRAGATLERLGYAGTRGFDA